ncbi:hypothetical protein MPSEU_000645400 [Mayamaea pseudoterrestris]|nr:hypothetical protein MPSEU_000645400 [Mayamaea pseudoterrestris]
MNWFRETSTNTSVAHKKSDDFVTSSNSQSNHKTEADPLLLKATRETSITATAIPTAANSSSSWMRARPGRSNSASPVTLLPSKYSATSLHTGTMEQQQQQQAITEDHEELAGISATSAADYEAMQDAASSSRLQSQQQPSSRQQHRRTSASHEPLQQQMHAPILEIPEEIYAIRKAALQVLKPLTKTWIVISVGFSLTVLFGSARWTQLMPSIPFWFILLPCWSSHVGLLILHLYSAKALSQFIAHANESRQRPDSRDPVNRTEYLPLLQRSLKFGFKTGVLSFLMFLLEILVYIRVARQSLLLGVVFLPLWLLVSGGILDGLICKNQHYLRVICWIMMFVAMVLAVVKVDYHYDLIKWRIVVAPIVAVLSIASGTLIYIVFGHQAGYYRLTESQLTAGNLYSLAALICIVLVVVVGEVMPQSRPVAVETQLFVVILAPLVICLVGMGAWVVSRDEFARLLLYGGQSTVHPRRLKWEAKGWNCVQGKGVAIIPMFGEVSFHPLERKPSEHVMELCACCSGACYPYEEEDEETVHLTEDLHSHPYLDSEQQRTTYTIARGAL